jgi:hypothetical protein
MERNIRDNNNYNSKFSHLLETGHAFGKIDDIMEILYCDKKDGI